jgi:hypothetical protein
MLRPGSVNHTAFRTERIFTMQIPGKQDGDKLNVFNRRGLYRIVADHAIFCLMGKRFNETKKP